MTALPMQSVAEPFMRLRAISHLRRGSVVILARGIGQPYVTTDYPSVQCALYVEADALLVAKRGVDGVYDSDPKTHTAAVKYKHTAYDDAIRPGIEAMDVSAFVLAREQKVTMYDFDVAAEGAMRRICLGEDVGTRVRP